MNPTETRTSPARLACALLGLLVVASGARAQDAPQTLARGRASAAATPGPRVVRTPEALAALGAELGLAPLPSVDFSREVVLAVVRPSGSPVQITAFASDPRGLIAEVDETDRSAEQATGRPYHLVRAPRAQAYRFRRTVRVVLHAWGGGDLLAVGYERRGERRYLSTPRTAYTLRHLTGSEVTLRGVERSEGFAVDALLDPTWRVLSGVVEARGERLLLRPAGERPLELVRGPRELLAQAAGETVHLRGFQREGRLLVAEVLVETAASVLGTQGERVESLPQGERYWAGAPASGTRIPVRPEDRAPILPLWPYFKHDALLGVPAQALRPAAPREAHAPAAARPPSVGIVDRIP